MAFDTEDGPIYVYGDNATVSAENVYIEYSEQTEYTNNEVLLQVNQNIVDGFSLMTGLFGMLIGFIAIKELLKIWLQ